MTTANAARRKRTLLTACIAFALTAGGGAMAAPGAPGTHDADILGAAIQRPAAVPGVPGNSARFTLAGTLANLAATPHATVAVTNCNDSGPGSLRAVAALGGVVVADMGSLQCSTITLTSGAIASQATLLFIQGPGAAALTIDGNHVDRVFYTGNNLTVDGLTIINGHAPTAHDGEYSSGGCMLARQSLVVADSIVSDCQAGDFNSTGYAYGGGIAAGVLSLVNSTVSGNHAYATAGAAGGGVFAIEYATVYGSTISGNAAKSYSYEYSAGGGIASDGDLTIHGSTISANSIQSYGGGVYGGGVYSDGDLAIYASHISDNSARTYEGYAYGGGANSNDDLLIQSSTISGNTAWSFAGSVNGGGAYSEEDLYLRDSSVTGNVAHSFEDRASGGGVYAGEGAYVYSSTVADNTARTNQGDAFGGGIYGDDESVLVDSTVSGNLAQGRGAQGGGLSSDQIYASGLVAQGNVAKSISSAPARGGGLFADYSLQLRQSRIAGNRAEAQYGDAFGGGLALGGVYDGSIDIDLMLEQSTIDGNTAGSGCHCKASGGGVYITDRTTGARTVALSASTISHNTARSANGQAYGGGILGPALHLYNMTVAYNTALGFGHTGDGGGIYLSADAWTIENSTVTGNYANNHAGGIRISNSSATLVSSIVYGNSAFAPGADIWSGSAVGLTMSGSNDLVGSVSSNLTLPGGTIHADPLLLPLADHGGPTQTMKPDVGSPAIDAGSDPQGLVYDQRGAPFARRYGQGVDIGAYEVQPAIGDIIFVDGFDEPDD